MQSQIYYFLSVSLKIAALYLLFLQISLDKTGFIRYNANCSI